MRILILIIIVNLSIFNQLLAQKTAKQKMIDSLFVRWQDNSLHDTLRLQSLHDMAWNGFLFVQPDSARALGKILEAYARDKGLLKSVAAGRNLIGATWYVESNYDSALSCYRSAYQIQLKIGNEKGAASCASNVAMINMAIGNYNKALRAYRSNVNIYEKLNDTLGLARILGNISIVYRSLSKYDSASICSFESLRLYQIHNDISGIAGAYHMIGLIYQDQKQYLEAYKYQDMAIKLFMEIGDSMKIANSYNTLGALYTEQNQFKKAISIFKNAVRVLERIGNLQYLGGALGNLALVYAQMDQLDSAIFYQSQAQKIAIYTGDKTSITTAICSKGVLFLKANQSDSAIYFGKKALTLAEEISSLYQIFSCAELLYKAYKRSNQFRQALEMKELMVSSNDSLLSAENTKSIIREETKHEFEKAQILEEQKKRDEKWVANEETKRRDNLQYSVILIALLLVFTAVAGLGFVKVSPKVAEGLIFFSFLILFEFILVLADPYVDVYSGGAPGYKLLFNAVLAGLIFPLHAWFEKLLKLRLIKSHRKA